MKFVNLSDYDFPRVKRKQLLVSAVLVVCFFIYGGLKGLYPFQIKEKMISSSQYSALGNFMDVNKTAQKTKAINAVPFKDGYRVNNVGNNDPGFPIMIGILGTLGIDLSSKVKLGAFNLTLMFIAILTFVLVVFTKSKNLIIGSLSLWWMFYSMRNLKLHKFTVKLVDHHGLVPFLVVLAFVFTFWLLNTLEKKNNKLLFIYMLPLAFFLAWANLIRQAVGTILVISFMLSIIIYYMKDFNTKNIMKGIFFALFLSLSVKGLFGLIQYGVSSQTEYALGDKLIQTEFRTQSHGLWHNLFLGLGQLENKWGITWGSDLVGHEFAKKVNPDVVYGSHEYHKILKAEYFRYFKENTGEYVYNYSAKAMLVCQKMWKMILFIILSFLSMKLPLMKRKKYEYRFNHFADIAPYFLIVCGTLTIPTITHTSFDHAFVTSVIMIIAFYPLAFFKKVESLNV